MRIQARSVRRFTTVGAIAVAGLVAGAPAQASDSSLRKVIKQQEKKADVVAEDFAEASAGVESAVGRERAASALKKLQVAVRRLRVEVADEKATTTKVRRGRTQYLDATDDVITGLKTFGQGIAAFDPDAPAKAENLYKKSATQLKSAATRVDRAKKAIGGVS